MASISTTTTPTRSAVSYYSYHSHAGIPMNGLFHSAATAKLGMKPLYRQQKVSSFGILQRSSSSPSLGRHRCTLMSTVSNSLSNEDEDISSQLSSSTSQQNDDDDELMYVLGVNLARQLGDIRPLLVSPDDNEASATQQYAKELSQVTAGIVDTIIGRVNEQQQIALLQRHGNALNALIQERA